MKYFLSVDFCWMVDQQTHMKHGIVLYSQSYRFPHMFSFIFPHVFVLLCISRSL